jgi:hypothetical protein
MGLVGLEPVLLVLRVVLLLLVVLPGAHQYAPTGCAITLTVRHMMTRSPVSDQFST